MKSILLFISVFASNYIFAQNSVGIGTTTPIATLEVVRGTAPLGTAVFHGTINTSYFNIGITEDTYINGGKAGSHVVLNYAGSGLVGIGTLTPFSPLTFNNNLGQKISLFGNSSNNYGFGIAGGTLQIHSDAAGADIAFGYGSSAAFTERMRIMGNGNVGIGVVNPQHPLDINGRMRLSGTNPNDPGIWLNNAGIDRAFVGLQNNSHVGFYGTGGIAWGFTMNTGTGALALNGNAGSAGQVITSNGAASPSWTSPTNALFQNTTFKTLTASITPGATYTLIPGLSHTVNISGNAKILVQFCVNVQAIYCAFCVPSAAQIDIYLNGGLRNRYLKELSNNATDTFSGSWMFSVGTGTYTVELIGFSTGPEVRFGNDIYPSFGSSLIVQVIPE